MKFSTDSKKLVISTHGNASIVVDGGNAQFKFYLSGYLNNAGLNISANFTPDSKYVFCGEWMREAE